MSADCFLRKQLGALRPIDPAGEDIIAGIPNGELVRVTIRRPRNVAHHRKFFALIKAIFPHQDLYPTQALLLDAIKKGVGLGYEWVDLDGEVHWASGSISFARMDQAAFEQFYEPVVRLILTRILPGVGRADLDREVEDILAGYEKEA